MSQSNLIHHKKKMDFFFISFLSVLLSSQVRSIVENDHISLGHMIHQANSLLWCITLAKRSRRSISGSHYTPDVTGA